jgi:hypothetical protein
MSTSRQQYVAQALDLYRRTPGVASVRRADRRLAGELHDRRVPLSLIQAALLLASVRRIFRSRDASPLTPVATLYYFLPVIDELRATPPEPGYLAYLRNKLITAAPGFIAALDHPIARTGGHQEA